MEQLFTKRIAALALDLVRGRKNSPCLVFSIVLKPNYISVIFCNVISDAQALAKHGEGGLGIHRSCPADKTPRPPILFAVKSSR